ncbi:ABC-three component system middle component 8 [Acanthopleuribacter pedis]|uniref:Uncharacterized protein n=1 Tax=Acanthopleuribacter pedis TaxID=442870 RepID=A0A8J7Q5H3_9BACT|nr:ABC-three component system middle component 8 [Acanthopleuribacter pedis]MBO1318492.1 hypothetical protein [Acanthopleuribacter pedis]
MLRPSKHAHPDKTVIFMAIILLQHLKNQRREEFQTLKDLAKAKIKGGEPLFLPALSFLYLLGLIDYHRKTDAIEYLGPVE